MAEDRKSLNLIQRALDRKAGRDNGPASVDHIASTQVPLRVPPMANDAPAAPASMFAATPAESFAPAAPAPVPPAAPVTAAALQPQIQTIRLNMGVLRRSGMINPELKISTIANEFRNIKRKVLLAARDKKSREIVNNLVMVTSTLPEEGKTFTSMNLALSMAAERDLRSAAGRLPTCTAPRSENSSRTPRSPAWPTC